MTCFRELFIGTRHCNTCKLHWQCYKHPYSRGYPPCITNWCMMTSSNGNIFCVSGHLCGEFTGHRWIPLKGQWRGALMFSLICAWINGWINNGDAGDLRRHGAHYDVTVMMNAEGIDLLIHLHTSFTISPLFRLTAQTLYRWVVREMRDHMDYHIDA